MLKIESSVEDGSVLIESDQPVRIEMMQTDSYKLPYICIFEAGNTDNRLAIISDEGIWWGDDDTGHLDGEPAHWDGVVGHWDGQPVDGQTI